MRFLLAALMMLPISMDAQSITFGSIRISLGMTAQSAKAALDSSGFILGRDKDSLPVNLWTNGPRPLPLANVHYDSGRVVGLELWQLLPRTPAPGAITDRQSFFAEFERLRAGRPCVPLMRPNSVSETIQYTELEVRCGNVSLKTRYWVDYANQTTETEMYLLLGRVHVQPRRTQ